MDIGLLNFEMEDWKKEDDIVHSMKEDDLEKLHMAKAKILFFMSKNLVDNAVKQTGILMSNELQEIYDTDINTFTTWQDLFSASYSIFLLYSAQYYAQTKDRVDTNVFGVTDSERQLTLLLKTCLVSFALPFIAVTKETSIFKTPGAPPLCQEAEYAIKKVEKLHSLEPDLTTREKMNYLIFLPLAIMKQLDYAEATLASIHHKPTLN